MSYSPLKVFHHQGRLKVLREGGQPAPAQVQLVISDFCNQNCSFCSYRWEGYTSNELFRVIREDGTADNNPKRMIPLGKCLEILDDCRDMGVGAVQITGGGEPTAHPDHPTIFEAVLDRGLDLALVTNGVIQRDGVPELLTRAKWVRVSIDAGNAETYARVRRVPASQFAKVWANVRRLCEARDTARSDVVIGVGFVVTRDNWREVVDAAGMARDAGADNIRISAVFQPDDERYFDGFQAEAAELCRKAAELSGGRFRVFNMFGDRTADLTQHAPNYSFCGYQHFATYIAATLQVFRCCVTSYSSRGLVGSIAGQRFRDLWESQGKRDDYAAFDARGCDRCMFNEKNRTIAYAASQDPPHVNFV
jgi:MoaA/NifB/PqqE/SkfB family radical SAM enzyme